MGHGGERASNGTREGAGETTHAGARRVPLPLLVAGVLLVASITLFSCSGCSPVYVARAGWTEMKILAGRRPLEEVIQDPSTDAETRHKLLLARQARSFAIHMLRLNAGDSYTSFTRLDRDTLAWVLSAAYKDRLVSKTWWFPIVGRVPYKGYASHGSAEKAEEKLQKQGFDTYLRTTSAFSTLGWFADPLLSSILRYDDVELVATILHELSHNQLFVPGHVRFNESYATFVGQVGAIRFFCGMGGQQQTPECRTARRRWEEYTGFSSFLDRFVPRLQAVYDSVGLSLDQKIEARRDLMVEEQSEWGAPGRSDASPLVISFLSQPLNNAILLARMRYFHRLSGFDALLREHRGDLAETVAYLTKTVGTLPDPFDALPSGATRGGTPGT